MTNMVYLTEDLARKTLDIVPAGSAILAEASLGSEEARLRDLHAKLKEAVAAPAPTDSTETSSRMSAIVAEIKALDAKNRELSRNLAAACRSTPFTAVVLVEVAEERTRQDAKWGEQNHPDHPATDEWAELVAMLESNTRESLLYGKPTWAAILAEEVGEALQEDDPVKLRAELVQIAAVAVAWIEAIDRRGAR